MSLTKLVQALEALGLDMAAVIDVVGYVGATHLEDAVSVANQSAPKMTQAERAKAYRERKASRGVTRKSDDRHAASRDGVTVGVTESDAASHGVTPRAPASELSSPSASLSFTEKTEEKRGERESAPASASHAPSHAPSRTPSRTPSRGAAKTVTEPVTPRVTEEPDLVRHADALRIALVAGYKKAGVPPPMKYLGGLPFGPVLDIARSVEPKDVNRFVEGFFANARARKEGFPIHFAASSPAQYLVEPQRQRSSTPIGLLETDEEFEEDFKRIQEASARTRAASFAALAEEEGRTNA